ncbi:VCBS repeat-containing protein [Fervidibacillus halotolerans]|uniref:VCBS repeat-containing protein n=1 Tax=Fervidibacillus halotolerans TaxID=2980027 RepID=A0A9E8S0L8_9BACI|nr:VCBS repeat-containing protein [Fervidibacillus halotolerans]WAA12707.1 VCBS repeat-containing protein [Fervidibacillus halotolerans]
MYKINSWPVPKIVAFSTGDVTGDGICDYVYVTGVKTTESPFLQKIMLIVQNGKTGMLTPVSLKNDAGYNPSLFLGDFTGNGVQDILIGIATGGSGGIMNYYLYSFLGNYPQLLFDDDSYNDVSQFEVNYLDDYKVKVFSKWNEETYLIDLTLRDESYLNEIYDSNGNLKQPIQGFVNPLSGLYPVDFDSNRVYELLAYQKIAGRYNADTIGFVLNTLGWNGKRFTLENQFVAIIGSKDE